MCDIKSPPTHPSMLLWVPALHQIRSQALSVAAARLQLASAGRKRIFQSLLAMGLSNNGRLRSPFSVGSCCSLAHKLGGGPGMPHAHARSGYEQATVYPSSGTLQTTKRGPMATLAPTDPLCLSSRVLILWPCLAPPGFCWPSLVFPGCSWLLLAPHGSLWLLLAPTCSTWLLLAPSGFS